MSGAGSGETTFCSGFVATIKFGNRQFVLPGSRIARIIIGLLLIVGGVLGFLPVLGFWMIPLGLVVLSIDLPIVRRWRRRATIRLGRFLNQRFPGVWASVNGDNGRSADHER